MTKISLSHTFWYRLSEVQRICKSISPVPSTVAFQHDGMVVEDWRTMSWSDFLEEGELIGLSFFALHAFAAEPVLVDSGPEDPNLFDAEQSGYRQNYSALWEVYVWDSSAILVVLGEGCTFTPPSGWPVDWIRTEPDTLVNAM